MKKEVSELEPVHSTTIVERNFNVSRYITVWIICKLIDRPSALMGLMQILSTTKVFLLRFYPESVCNRQSDLASIFFLYALSIGFVCATF